MFKFIALLPILITLPACSEMRGRNEDLNDTQLQQRASELERKANADVDEILAEVRSSTENIAVRNTNDTKNALEPD